jgi:Zn-dependent peptidase ImmA (M78 family)/transcriptional regulator with XRE-family HTH domain
MPSFAEALSQARHSAKLALKDFARLAGVSDDTVRGWEAGEVPSGAELERAALVFGLGVSDFLEGAALQANMTLLFKRTRESESGRATSQLAELETNLGPNRFCRSVMHVSRLVDASPVRVPALTVPAGGGNPGDPMAKSARQALGLDPAGPIPSMRRLLTTWGVQVFAASTDEVDRRINGASTLTPVPAILVSRQSNEPWLLRMTLAHELGHLLFHAGRFCISPAGTASSGTWSLDRDFERMELEADAFAAAFLAPRFAVQDLLQQRRLSPETPAAVAAVGEHFGVGREVAINRIVDSMGLATSARERLRAMAVKWKGGFEDDTFGDDETGLERGPLRAAVMEALRADRIDESTAREYLSVPAGVTLEGQPEADFQERRIARLIQQLLLEQGWAGIVSEVESSADGWRARLVTMSGERVGTVRLTPDEGALVRADA